MVENQTIRKFAAARRSSGLRERAGHLPFHRLQRMRYKTALGCMPLSEDLSA
jgi:hypothetical protein